MTPNEALRSATLHGAQYLGLDGDLGSLEEGKVADLVVIDGNPLEDLRRTENIDRVMVNGRLFDAATMNQIGHHPSERAPFGFQREGGARSSSARPTTPTRLVPPPPRAGSRLPSALRSSRSHALVGTPARRSASPPPAVPGS